MKNILKTSILLLAMSLVGFGAFAGEDTATVTTTGAQDGISPASQQHIGESDCREMQSVIDGYCPNNSTLQNNSGASDLMTRAIETGGTGDTGARDQVAQAGDQGRKALTDLTQANSECQAAERECVAKCDRLTQHGIEQINRGRQPPGNPDLVRQGNEDMNYGRQMKRYCEQTAQAQQAKNAASMAEIGQLLQGVAQLLSALGMGGDDSPMDIAEASEEEEEGDVCEGPDKELYLKCLGASDPLTSTAGVGGTGVPELGGGTANGVFGKAVDGKPGGTDQGLGGNRAPASAGGGAIGSAGFGSGGGFPSSGSGSGSGSSGEGLDTDLYKGYMGGGSGGIGSYGGGGGGGGGRLSSSGLKAPKFKKPGKNRLQAELDKIATKSGRTPASLGGPNGPMMNIWGVVTKSYKKASPSMFHKD